MNRYIKLIKQARFIWICGNGGSAATAEHFATDLVKKGYRAIALSSNTSLITMIANDYGYDQIFSKQLEILSNSEDLLIGISCSGSSPNMVKAYEQSYEMGQNSFEFKTFVSRRNYGELENKHLKFAHDLAAAL